MKWNLQWLIKQKDGNFVFEDEFEFPKEMFESLSTINGLKNIHVCGNGHLESKDHRLYVDMKVEGIMILPCALTLEEVEYPFEMESTEVFAFEKAPDDEDVIEVKGQVVDITPVIFQNIMMEVPTRVVKEGAQIKTTGQGWKMMSEEDENQNLEDDIDPRLAKLKDYFKDR